jgi:hypothetical protein
MITNHSLGTTSRTTAKKILTFAWAFLTSAVTATAAQPTGLYQLGAPNIRDLSFVEGGTAVVPWETTELAAGVYDFSGVDDALTAVQAVGKKLVLHPFASRLPAHVLSQVPVDEQYFNTQFGVTTAVPWSATALSHWSTFSQALADHLVLDASTGLMVRLADHPSLESVDAPIVGLQGFRDLSQSVTSLANYSRSAFVDGILSATHTSRNAFPNIAGHQGFFGMNDGLDTQFGGQTLNDAVLDRLEADFNGPGQPRMNFLQENWSDQFPSATGSQGQNTLRFIADGGGHMLQALTSWTRPFGQNGQAPTEQRQLNVASGTPIQGIVNAFNTFGTRWFEIYAPDFDNAAAPTNQVYLGNGQFGDVVEPYADQLWQWNEFLSDRFALADIFSSIPDGDAEFDLLANDIIPAGANVTLLVTEVTQGMYGSVTILNGGASVLYQPGLTFAGVDQFQYWVSDGKGGLSTAIVSIRVPEPDSVALLLTAMCLTLIHRGACSSDQQ